MRRRHADRGSGEAGNGAHGPEAVCERTVSRVRRAACGAGSVRVSIVSALVAALLVLAPCEAQAQSSGLGWLRGIEKWTHKEDYRTWIGHGVVTTASTLLGHWAFGKSHYGAGAAVMFYVGVEYQELRRDDWVVHNKLDKFMDLAVPITVGTLLVTLLSDDDRPQAPPLTPWMDGEEESEEAPDGVPIRPVLHRVAFASAPPPGIVTPMLPLRRGTLP